MSEDRKENKDELFCKSNFLVKIETILWMLISFVVSFVVFVPESVGVKDVEHNLQDFVGLISLFIGILFIPMLFRLLFLKPPFQYFREKWMNEKYLKNLDDQIYLLNSDFDIFDIYKKKNGKSINDKTSIEILEQQINESKK